MANLTLTIDDRLLLRARKRALEQGTSVNALAREYLESYTGDDEAVDAAQALVALAKSASGSSGSSGRNWTRGDIHER